MLVEQDHIFIAIVVQYAAPLENDVIGLHLLLTGLLLNVLVQYSTMLNEIEVDETWPWGLHLTISSIINVRDGRVWNE